MDSPFHSLSPIDHSVVWNGHASTPKQVRAAIDTTSLAAPLWRQTPLDERVATVRRYAKFLESHRQELSDLIVREVGKLPWDADGEVAASIAKAELSIDALSQRRSEQRTQLESVQRVTRYLPLGVVLVLGPFNFPIHLPGGQIIPALLAGNGVVFKPSDQATALGEWMIDAWRQVGLPDGVLTQIVGGAATAVHAIDDPRISGVFLTGSLAAGRAIHQQLAGRPEVLLALELGGNNPIVVMDAAEEMVADVISFSAFISAGQRCTCARRAIFVDGPPAERQIEALVRRVESLRVGMPNDAPMPEIGPLISASAVESIKETFAQLVAWGCRPLVAPAVSHGQDTLLGPAMVDASDVAPSRQQSIAELEWFGPLLVIQRASDFEQATRLAADTPYGLAAALLGGDAGQFEHFVASVGAGVVNWNRPTTGAAGASPFGGRGSSGNHRPAGFHAIDFCGDPVSSLEAETLPAELWKVAR